MTDDPVRTAEFEVDRARSRMIATSQEILRQLQPHRLVQEAWETAKDKGADLAENAVDAVRARPLAATGVVAAVAMLLAREPIVGLAGKLVNGINGHRAKRKRRKTERAQPKHNQTETAE